MDGTSTSGRPRGGDTRATAGPPVVVVGAGFAGLAAAVRLADAGRKVVLVEATKAGGGRSRSFMHESGRELDNGQHLMMGCYHETLAFLRTIGAEGNVSFQRNLAMDMVKVGGGRIKLRCPALPAPLHLAAGLVRMRGLGLLHKASALRMGLFMRGEVARPDDNETCDTWLRRLGQTQGIRGAFWDPLIWAVLNDDPLVASAAMLVAVLERAFLGTRDASRLGVPRLPLSRLYVDDAVAHLRARGAELRFASPMRAILTDERGVRGVQLRNGDVIDARAVVSAVPPPALLDALPEPALRDPVFQDVARLTTSPIVNLWLFLDRPLFDDVPFLGLVQSPLHWLFDRSRIEGRDDGDHTLLNVTISGARGFVDDSPEVLVDLFKAEAARYFPGRRFTVLQSKVVKEKRATISHAAGTYHRRPEVESPIPGLWLAGDWVRTGLPATIESACASGHMAAAGVLDR
ncbi:MAG TPA: hydroxysqualene dehydroxylase HpnE [Nannocystaceae bacterium]|nr:hydroxysqualene dehydroxylase HpnE [Nannocystaceae bacterium]